MKYALWGGTAGYTTPEFGEKDRNPAVPFCGDSHL